MKRLSGFLGCPEVRKVAGGVEVFALVGEVENSNKITPWLSCGEPKAVWIPPCFPPDDPGKCLAFEDNEN